MSPIEPTGMAPLLQVYDMQTSLAFYRDVIGFKMVQQSDPHPDGHFDWCMLELGGVYLMLNTAYERDERPPLPDAVRRAHHFDMSFYIGVADIDAVHAHLIAKNQNVAPPQLMRYGMRELTITDPDGFELHFQQRA